VANRLRNDISRSMSWLRESLSLSSPVGTPVGRKETRNPVRDVFTDLIAYVLFFLGSLDQRSPSLSEVREKIKSLIAEQEKRAKSGDVLWESYLEARFAVLSWMDEMILTSTWPNRNQWQHLMLPYHGT
jgi:type VI protein secretion system component VasF